VIQHNVVWAEAYLCAQFHLDPSSHLTTMHQRCRPTDSTVNGLIAWGEPFYKQSPKRTENKKRTELVCWAYYMKQYPSDRTRALLFVGDQSHVVVVVSGQFMIAND